MLICKNCQRTYQDETSEGVERSLGKLYCSHCGTPLSEAASSAVGITKAGGAAASIVSNSDNSINTNSNNTTNNNTTTNNTTNNSSTTITNIYKSEESEIVYTKYGDFKKEEVRRCKSCKEYVPISHLVGDTGICQECWVRIQKKEGDSAFIEGLYEESKTSYEKVLNATYGDEDLRQELMFKIGRCYFELKDGKKAISCFAKSKEKYPDSIYYLGRCMELGLGKPRDTTMARDYYKEAARKGSDLARLELEKQEKAQPSSKAAITLQTPVNLQEARPQVVLQHTPVRSESSNKNYLIAAAVLAVIVIGYFVLGGKDNKKEISESPAEQVVVQENSPSSESAVEEPRSTNIGTKESKVEKNNTIESDSRKEVNTEPTTVVAGTPATAKHEGLTQSALEQASAPTTTSALSDADLVAQGKKAMRAMDYSKAKSSLMQAANHGNTEANFQLGMLYSNSNFDGYSRETAKTYFIKAARNNHVEAMYQAGMMCLGVDNSSAKSWFEKAAAAGHSRAEVQLSKLQ